MNTYGKRLSGAAKGSTIINIYGNTIWCNRGIHQAQQYAAIEEHLSWEEIRKDIYGIADSIRSKASELDIILKRKVTLQQMVILKNMQQSLNRKMNRLESYQEEIKHQWNNGKIKTWKDVAAMKKKYKLQ